MRLIRLKEVLHKTGLGRSTVYEYIAAGEFPRNVNLGERAVAWVEEEVNEWVNKRRTGSCRSSINTGGLELLNEVFKQN